MFRTVKFKSESEGRFRTVLIKRDEKIQSLTYKLGPTTAMAVIASLIMSLGLLPTCRSYSITSSLGPSSYALDVQDNPAARVSSLAPPPSSQLSYGGVTSATVSPDLTVPGAVLSSSSHVDSHTYRSISSSYVDDETSGSERTYEPSSGGDHHHKRSPQPSQSQDKVNAPPQQQFTRTQLQVAGRILFESRVTTPKPNLGYRAFSRSSYRNPNYFGKKTKYSESSYIPNRSKNIYATSSSQVEEVEEQDGEEGEEDQLHETLDFHASFVNTTKSVTVKSVKGHTPSVIFPTASSGSTYQLPKEMTTPESKTAPATSVYSVSERPSSTQQMQSDSPHNFPVNLTESESNNHYQFNNRDQQQWADHFNNGKRPLQIDASIYQNQSFTSARPPHVVDIDGEAGVEDESATAHSDLTRDVKEEPIVFPTTTSSQRTYKIPSHGLDESDLAGLKNILENRKGNDGESKTNGAAASTSPSVPKYSPVPLGAKEPPCAKKLGYCDMDSFKDNYPRDLLNSVLTNSISSDVFKQVFGDDTEASASALAGSPDNVVLAGRNNIINAAAEETALCGSQEVTIYPRAAPNKDDKWMIIVNHDDYVQGVKVEKCMNEGSPCLFSEGNPLGYESVCRQKFILRKLVALNGEGKTSLDTFKLPSCCVCYIKTTHVSNRLGISTSSASRPPVLSDKGSTGPSTSPSDGGNNNAAGISGNGETNNGDIGPTGCTPYNIVPPKDPPNNLNISTSPSPPSLPLNGSRVNNAPVS